MDFKEWNVEMWIGLSWLVTGSYCCFCDHGYEHTGSFKADVFMKS